MTVNHVKIEPGSDRHLTLLGAPMHLNMLVGQDREDMLAFGQAVWQAARLQCHTEAEGKAAPSEVYTCIPGFPNGAIVEIPRAYTGRHKDAWIDGFNKAREMFSATKVQP